MLLYVLHIWLWLVWSTIEGGHGLKEPECFICVSFVVVVSRLECLSYVTPISLMFSPVIITGLYIKKFDPAYPKAKTVVWLKYRERLEPFIIFSTCKTHKDQPGTASLNNSSVSPLLCKPSSARQRQKSMVPAHQLLHSLGLFFESGVAVRGQAS